MIEDVIFEVEGALEEALIERRVLGEFSPVAPHMSYVVEHLTDVLDVLNHTKEALGQ